jgi:F0F1-type ATP synthase assembly protein I
MLVYAIFMVIAILIGMYVGWWSLVREEEEEKTPPPANTHSEVSYLHSRLT